MSELETPGGAAGIRRAVVAGGAGAVGEMFTALLTAAGVDVCVADRQAPASGARWMESDVTVPGGTLRDELSRADMLLLALPEAVALKALPALDGVLAGSALLADTLSVKGRIAAVLERLPTRRQIVCLNPMFAPSLGMSGRPVAAVVLHDGPLARDLLGVIARAGGHVIEMDALRHDRLAAASQVLTHATVLAFGQALSELDVDIDELVAAAPPPHATLLSLLARIASGTPEVYWDIQSANPFTDQAHRALGRGLDRLRHVVACGGEAEFERLLNTLSGRFGAHLPYFRNLCSGLFAQLPAVSVSVSEENP